jgi:hypothetical protein
MKIVFLTTSTFSDIQEIQSKCIKRFFPNSDHILIDGRGGWFSIWYKWLDISKNYEADWYIHLDEDCFVTSDSGILEHIQFMIENGIDISGCPDGHFEYRSGNHMALNSFFMIMNRKCIDSWFDRKEVPQFRKEWIEEYPYKKTNVSHYEWNMEFGTSGKPLHLIWKPDTEPYYDFMWVLKDAGCKFFYIEPVFGEEFQTTNLLNGTIIHMWHQRERFVERIVSTLHKITNRKRFELVIQKIKKIIENEN